MHKGRWILAGAGLIAAVVVTLATDVFVLQNIRFDVEVNPNPVALVQAMTCANENRIETGDQVYENLTMTGRVNFRRYGWEAWQRFAEGTGPVAGDANVRVSGVYLAGVTLTISNDKPHIMVLLPINKCN